MKTTKNTVILKYDDIVCMSMGPDYLTIWAKGGEIFLLGTAGKSANIIFKEYGKLIREKIKKEKRERKTSKMANKKRKEGEQ